MLMWAAKAVGYDTSHHWNVSRMDLDPPIIDLCIPGVSTAWNPLIHEGERYRLARDLRMSIDFDDCYVCKRFPDHTLIQEFWGGECGDEAHAVLRVAAEIGRRMDSGSKG